MKLKSAKIGLLSILALVVVSAPQDSYSGTFDGTEQSIRCVYKEGRRPFLEDTSVELNLVAAFDPANATLRSVRGTLTEWDREIIEVTHFEQETAERLRYNGTKYRGHFRFHLDSFRGLEYCNTGSAHLIISPEARRVHPFGTFYDAVLDVHYSDHHGDYVPVNCWIDSER